MRDLHNNTTVEVAFTPQDIGSDTTTAGEIIDMQDYDALELVITAGTLTSGAYAMLVESGNDSALSDAAAVADVHLLGTEADAGFAFATDSDTSKSVGVVAHHGKRYVRLSIVSTGFAVAGGIFSATAVKGNVRSA